MRHETVRQGIVIDRDDACLRVRIVQVSACASCEVSGHCASADRKEKVVEVDAPGNTCAVGDRVAVVCHASMGMKAVLLAFVVPFVLLTAALFVCHHLSGGNELLSGLVALGLPGCYYVLLWLGRHRLKRSFVFTIKPNK